MKKILFIDNGVIDQNPGISGGEIRFIETAKIWQKNGYQVHLFTTNGGHQLAKKFKLNHKFHKSFSYPKNSKLIFFLNFFKSFFLYHKIKKINPNIVYSANDSLIDTIPAYILKNKKKNNVKWVATIHWLPPFPPWKRKQATPINAIFFFINQRLSLYLSQKKADILLPISKSTNQQLIDNKIHHRPIYIGECGIDYYKIKNNKKTKTIKKYDAIFIKRLQAVKGIFDLIDIWEKVVQKKKTAKLIIIGEGNAESEIKKIIKKKKLNKNIKLMGPIYDFQQKTKLIEASKILILPSYEENWAIVIGEAMASGLPVVSYNLKELKQVWGKNVNYINLKDITAFSQKVIQLLDSPKTYLQQSIANQKFVSRFDWKKIIQKEIKFITNV